MGTVILIIIGVPVGLVLGLLWLVDTAHWKIERIRRGEGKRPMPPW